MEYETHEFSIIRRTSPYNKYIKWFAESYGQDGQLISSSGYRTEKEARAAMTIKENPFSVGTRLIWITMKERRNHES